MMIERHNDALAKETMEWDDIIHEEQAKRTELPEGDYSFTVKRLEKGRFEGSDKLPACNIATLTLEVPTEEGSVEIRTRLYLIRKLEYRICSFFRSIGQREYGEFSPMDWASVEGSEGRAHIKPRKYTDKNGREHTTNDVAYFIAMNVPWLKDAMNAPEEDLPL